MKNETSLSPAREESFCRRKDEAVSSVPHAMSIGLVTLMALGAPPPAGTYAVDSARTVLLVQLRPDDSRLLSGLSHWHVIRAMRPKGTIRFDPGQPDACRVEVGALVEDLQVDAPDMRRRVGYTDLLDDDDREDVRENMLDDDQLDGRRHPDIRFEGARCAPMPDGRVMVQGKLTVRGVSKSLEIPMIVTNTRGGFAARGEFTLTHAAFGFEPYSAALGTLANDDWLKFTIDIVARRAARPSKAATSSATKATKRR